MKTAQQVYDFLVAYMNKFSKPASAWYAGIATDPRARLFTDHNVDEARGTWAFDTAQSSEDARTVEAALLELGCDGGSGGGDDSTTACYVYLKTSETKE